MYENGETQLTCFTIASVTTAIFLQGRNSLIQLNICHLQT